MNFEFKKSKSGKLRGAMCDDETHISIEIFKNVSYLRPTYQIKLLAYRAAKEKKILIVSVPKVCILSPSMLALQKSVLTDDEFKQERIRILRLRD